MATQEEEKIVPVVNEDAELDKSLEESIKAVKAGNELTPPKKEEAKKAVTRHIDVK